MKFWTAFAAFLSVASAMTELKANSPLGQSLLSRARNLQNNNNNNAQFSDAWVANYSIKFQGCHHIKQWNDYANEDADVRIATKRLVRFRLCPSDSCSNNKSTGCSNGYGDYVIDMDSFMQAYSQVKNQEIEYQCQKHLSTKCSCENDGNQGDGFNRDYCMYDCFVNAGMSECIDQNPYQQDQVEYFEVERYMYCNQLQNQNNNNNNNNNGGNNNNNGGNKYYVGPFCSSQGGAIHLGLFTDDTCSTFSEVSFESLTGIQLPYTKESIISTDCLSCHEKNYDQEAANANQDANGYANDQQDADQVRESCELMYQNAGKCEANLADGTTSSKNNNACNYMEGIRIVRQDGIIDTSSSRPSAVATAFIVIFAMAFAAMAFYVWYLRTRLGIKQNALL